MRPSSTLRRPLAAHATVLALTLSAAACTPKPSSGGGDGEAPMVLADGAATVYQARRQDFTGVDPRVWDTLKIGVADVAVDGGRVTLTVATESSGMQVEHPVNGCPTCASDVGSAGGGIGYYVFVSSDLATWAPHAFGWTDAMGGYLRGVAMASGRAAVVSMDTYVTSLGTYNFFPVTDVDLGTDRYLPNARLVGQSRLFMDPPRQAGSRLWATWFDNDPRDVTRGTLALAQYDLATGTPGLVSNTDFTRTFCLPGSWASADGLTATGFCWDGAAPSQRLCRVALRSASPLTPVWSCADAGAVPGPGSDLAPVVTARGPVGLLTDGARAYAVSAEPAARVVDLGPGVPQGNDFGLHPRHGNLIQVGTRFMAVPALGPAAEVPLPSSPCASGQPCGTSARLEWVQPVGEGDWLLFWVVDTFQGVGLHERIVVSRYQMPGWADLGHSATAGTEASALEKVCMRAASCVPDRLPNDDAWLTSCVNGWLNVRTASPTADAEYQAFLATPQEGGCAAFATTWNLALAATHPSTGAPYCSGDVLMPALGAAHPLDCAAMGARCDAASAPQATCGSGVAAPACDTCDAQGNAIACFSGSPGVVVSECARLGKSCVAGSAFPPGFPGGVSHYCSAGPCTADPNVSNVCVGDVSVGCSRESLAAGRGHIVQQMDCSRVGLPCSAGWCHPPPVQSDCAGGYPSYCIGDVAVWCYNDSIRRIDCGALGLAGCAVKYGQALCVR